jgi:hypothetical protein
VIVGLLVIAGLILGLVWYFYDAWRVFKEYDDADY